MNRDEIIRMAREAGWDMDDSVDGFSVRLERFVALVAAAEREECAKVAETLTLDDLGSTDDWPDVIAAAIRSRE